MEFFHNSWDNILEDEFEKPYFKELMDKVDNAYKNATCYPPRNKIFSAFSYTPYEKVKVVILGQDPYHEPGQAQRQELHLHRDPVLYRSLPAHGVQHPR